MATERTPDMVSTENGKLCAKCFYSTGTSGNMIDLTCDYLAVSGKRRMCPVGWCNKFEPKGNVKKKNVLCNYNRKGFL